MINTDLGRLIEGNSDVKMVKEEKLGLENAVWHRGNKINPKGNLEENTLRHYLNLLWKINSKQIHHQHDKLHLKVKISIIIMRF